jgi:hypothetical protein
MLTKSAVNQLVKNIAGSTEMCFNLFRVNTGTTPERAWAYLDTTALMGLSAARTNTKVVVARGIAVRTPEYLNKQGNCAIRVSPRRSYKAGNAAAAPEACKRRLRSHIIRQRIHKVRQRLI